MLEHIQKGIRKENTNVNLYNHYLKDKENKHEHNTTDLELSSEIN